MVGVVSMDLGSIPPQSIDSELVGFHGRHGSRVFALYCLACLLDSSSSPLIRRWLPRLPEPAHAAVGGGEASSPLAKPDQWCPATRERQPSRCALAPGPGLPRENEIIVDSNAPIYPISRTAAAHIVSRVVLQNAFISSASRP